MADIYEEPIFIVPCQLIQEAKCVITYDFDFHIIDIWSVVLTSMVM